MKNTIKKSISILAGLALAVVLAMPYLLFRRQLLERETVGYLGLIVSCAIASLSILIPTSATLIVLAAASVLNPWFCAIFGGIGVAIGEQASYVCGRIGAIGFEKKGRRETKLADWLRKNAFLTVFLFALIPLPLFDLAGVAAGALRIPWVQFASAALLGKIVRFMLLLLILCNLLPFYAQCFPGEIGIRIRQILALYSGSA